MSRVRCSRCKEENAGLAEAPLPNELGRRVFEQTCAACWQEWVGQQLMLMNEHRLDPLNDEHSKFLDDEMVKFLNLD